MEENIGRTFLDTNHSKIFFGPLPGVMKIRTKINKWDLVKFKSFCTTKETISKVKRQPSEWEKIITNKATDKELISKRTPSCPSQPEGKIGLPRANPRGRLRSPS